MNSHATPNCNTPTLNHLSGNTGSYFTFYKRAGSPDMFLKANDLSDPLYMFSTSKKDQFEISIFGTTASVISLNLKEK
jgi:hypothetical protein